MEVDQEQKYWQKETGVAPIKSEYVLWDKVNRSSSRHRQDDDDAAEGRTKRGTVAASDRTTVDVEVTANGASSAALVDADDSAAQANGVETATVDGEPAPKKVRLSGGEKKKLAKAAAEEHRRQQREGDADGGDGTKHDDEKKKARGSNKGRNFVKTGEEVKLCGSTAIEKECDRVKVVPEGGEIAQEPAAEDSKGKGKGKKGPRQRSGWGDGCRFSHDVPSYLSTKPPDILSHLDTSFSDPHTDQPTLPANVAFPILEPKTVPVCPLFKEQGYCPFGYRCRFLSTHVSKHPSSPLSDDPVAVGRSKGYQNTSLSLVSNSTLHEMYLSSLPPSARGKWERGETNFLSVETMRLLRKKRYALEETKKYLESIGEPVDQRDLSGQGKKGKNKKGRGKGRQEEETKDDDVEMNDTKASDPDTANPTSSLPTTESVSASQAASKDLAIDLSPPRPSEKPRLHWGKSSPSLYLAPLTTVGNLPFRRLCTTLGADITCGEMALSQDLLGAGPSEWSLVRRWKGESCFGTQVAGSRAQVLVPTAEVLSKECKLDFVDVNCGCPIDLVFKKGAGSALLDHANKLGRSLTGMSRILNAQGIPLTFKLRTGVADNHPTAHKLIARCQSEWGISALTLHGRSRQQRYSKRADWSYIASCVKVLRDTAEELGEEPIPIYGNGDCYDYREYYEDVEQSGADGVMIARGGLIKPWLFTEIKERRDWDISARERLDLYGKLASFGLEHWGSDTQGVNTTRRFLCEAISFQYRYVPVGLLERLPARINERPFPFKGRNELETLLASPVSEDWVKISNMFLGPPPDSWSFVPKHKSNAPGGAEENG